VSEVRRRWDDDADGIEWQQRAAATTDPALRALDEALAKHMKGQLGPTGVSAALLHARAALAAAEAAPLDELAREYRRGFVHGQAEATRPETAE
jgi:hypothetical protein